MIIGPGDNELGSNGFLEKKKPKILINETVIKSKSARLRKICFKSVYSFILFCPQCAMQTRHTDYYTLARNKRKDYTWRPNQNQMSFIRFVGTDVETYISYTQINK